MARAKPKICFVAPTAYPVLSRSDSIQSVGGAEVQQTIIATELAKRGYDVSMICLDYGQKSIENHRGVTVFRSFSTARGVPVIRFVHPRLTGIVRSLRQAQADIYFQRAAGMLTGLVAAYARIARKRAIYSVASDVDLDVGPPNISHARDRLLFRYGIRTVDVIVVQGESQRERLSERYHRSATVIRNCLPEPTIDTDNADGYIIWAGMIRNKKRPDLFLDLAERLPHRSFKILGGSDASQIDLYRSLIARSNSLKNIEFVGFVPFHETERYFSGARLLVNTSPKEGFPNTFLQAWSRGIPSISFVSTDAVFRGEKVGISVSSLDEMAEKVDALMASEKEWLHHGNISRKYFEDNHAVNKVIDDYEKLLLSM